jgi:pilus assembly protein FimV
LQLSLLHTKLKGKAMRNIVKWVFVLTQIALFAPYQAGAQGLGDIELNSYLNQSLDAQISVTPAKAGELDEARIGLASKTDFEKAGIKRRAVLDLIKFKLVKSMDGKQAIKLTTQEPIKEPLLDFILEVTWPKGRLLREYSVMLDPPVTTQETAPPAQTSVMGASEARTMNSRAGLQQVTASTAPSPAIATRSIEPKLSNHGYGPTMRPNTLWDIAEAMRPDTSASIEQVMLAIVKKNPEAFYNNNVNALKAGYILRIPDKGLISQVSEADATKQVKLQYQRWQQSKH